MKIDKSNGWYDELWVRIYECTDCGEDVIGDECNYCSRCGAKIEWVGEFISKYPLE